MKTLIDSEKVRFNKVAVKNNVLDMAVKSQCEKNSFSDEIDSFINDIQRIEVDSFGYYGEFGGAFIPEILHSNIENLKS